MRRRITTILIILLCALFLFTTAVAWLSDTLSPSASFIGTVHKSYFESGDGTTAAQFIDGTHGQSDSGCAFEIKYPVQLYYFAWLQALGYFNQPTENSTTIPTTYFYLSSDLDMTGWILPQIGTGTYQFVGNFDGNGHTISNLTVQNVEESEGVEWTDSDGYAVSGLNIVGFFGVVGALSGNTNGAVISGDGFVATAGYTYSSQTNEAKNFILNNVTIRTDLSESLVGIAAGYVNGTLSNIKVVGGTIENLSAITPIFSSDLSEFGAVGYCTNPYKSTVSDTAVVQHDPIVVVDDGSGSTPGQGNNWGGSIDIKTLNLRLYNAFAQKVGTSTTLNNTSINDAQFNVTRSATSNPTTASVIYRWRTGAVVPLIMSDDFIAMSANNGYIVGSTIGTGVNGSPKSSSYYIDYLCYSLSNASATATKIRNHTQASYTPDRLEVLTRYNNNWVRIGDSYNSNNNSVNSSLSGYQKVALDTLGFTKYVAARDKLHELFQKADGTSEPFVNGIHFDTNAVSTSTTTSLASAKILGHTYTNYNMPIGCIDFHVQDAGKINFFAGSYYNLTSNTGTSAQLTSANLNDSFFSLHHIFRNSSQGLTGSKEISAIYTNTNTSNNATVPYVYKYTDNTYSTGTAGTLLFDMQYLWNAAPVVLTLYYFEIPVNPGEYALGAVKQGNTIKSKGAYLIYLDISANAERTITTTTTEVTETTTYTLNYPNGVAFVDSASSNLFNTNGVADPSKSVFLSIPINNSSGTTTFSMDSTKTLTVNGNSSLSGYTPQSVPQGAQLVVNNGTPITMTGTYTKVEVVTVEEDQGSGAVVTTVTTTTTTIVNGGEPQVTVTTTTT